MRCEWAFLRRFYLISLHVVAKVLIGVSNTDADHRVADLAALAFAAERVNCCTQLLRSLCFSVETGQQNRVRHPSPRVPLRSGAEFCSDRVVVAKDQLRPRRAPLPA